MRELAWRLRLLSAGAWNRLAGREPFRLLASSSRRRSLGRAVQEASRGPESRLLARFTFPRSCSAPASHQNEASVLHWCRNQSRDTDRCFCRSEVQNDCPRSMEGRREKSAGNADINCAPALSASTQKLRDRQMWACTPARSAAAQGKPYHSAQTDAGGGCTA